MPCHTHKGSELSVVETGAFIFRFCCFRLLPFGWGCGLSSILAVLGRSEVYEGEWVIQGRSMRGSCVRVSLLRPDESAPNWTGAKVQPTPSLIVRGLPHPQTLRVAWLGMNRSHFCFHFLSSTFSVCSFLVGVTPLCCKDHRLHA
jgi:hypothetical protein